MPLNYDVVDNEGFELPKLKTDRWECEPGYGIFTNFKTKFALYKV